MPVIETRRLEFTCDNCGNIMVIESPRFNDSFETERVAVKNGWKVYKSDKFFKYRETVKVYCERCTNKT